MRWQNVGELRAQKLPCGLPDVLDHRAIRFEVTAHSLPTKERRGRKLNAGSGFEPGHLRAYEGAASSLPSKLNRRRKPRTGLIFRHRTVAGSDRGRTCRLSSCDERVCRSNRSLTASEIEFWEKHGRSAPWLAPRHGFVNSEVTSPSLPRKSFGRKADEGDS
jgi:hypothetical protein